MMKKLLALLLAMMLVIPAAMANTVTLTTNDGLTLSHELNRSWAIDSDAELYIFGCYFDSDYETAYVLNLQLAEMGDTEAMIRLGCHLSCGLGTSQDDTAAFAWFTKAAQAGDHEAYIHLAAAHLNGWGTPVDPYAAIDCLNLLIEADAFFANTYRRSLAELYLLGWEGLSPDEAKALEIMEPVFQSRLYSREDPRVHLFESEEAFLATNAALYDESRASFLATQALSAALTDRCTLPYESDRGIWGDQAMQLGYIWHDGDGGVVDHHKAAYWFEKAIELSGGHDVAAEWSHAALADYYRDGTLGVYDVEKAIYHAERGCTRPYSYVGDMYWNGIISADGTVILAPDAEKAIEYYLQGVEWNDTGAIAFVADAYYTGENLPADYDQAIDLYLTGMQLGNAHCAEVLEGLYAEGKLYAPEMLRRLAWTAGNGSPSVEADAFLLTLAKDLMNGKIAKDGTVLVEAKQYEDAYRVLRHLASYEHLSNVWVNEQLGWFYSGNVPEVRQADYTWALRYYKAASDQGSTSATRELGILYRDGLGTEANPAAARYYFGIAAKAGDVQAQALLDAMDATE